MRLFKKIKPAYIALLLIVIMLGSSLTFGIFQSFYFTPANPNTIELPATNIIEYELTPEQEDILIRQGRTIFKYYYRTTCLECITFKSALEGLANQFSDQILLESIVDNSKSTPSLTVFSFYGQKFLDNPGQNETVDAVCELMINPPVTCATRKV